MRKPSIVVLVLAAVAGASQVGCRMCQNCLDYSSPVAGASCGGCQECRAGTCMSAGVAASSDGTMVAEAPNGPMVR